MNFNKLEDYLNSLHQYGIVGCDTAVFHKGKSIFRHITGYSSLENSTPLSENNLYFLYSLTKVVTCCAIMRLIEEGQLSVEDQISQYLPSFSKMQIRKNDSLIKAKEQITIKHLMTMTAGLDYDVHSPSITKEIKRTSGEASTRQIVDAIANEPLSFEPSTRFQYSLCHDVLAAIIEVVTKISFGEYLSKIFFDPLGMKNTSFRITDANISKISDLFVYDQKNKISKKTSINNIFAIAKNYESGGGGLISTVDDYTKFANALSNNGTSHCGEKILSEFSIKMMSKNQLQGIALEDFRKMSKIGYGYGLGVRTLIDKSSSKSPLGEFGWDGAAGSYVLIDPINNLTIFYAQHILGCEYAFNKVHPTIRDMTYEITGLGV